MIQKVERGQALTPLHAHDLSDIIKSSGLV
jgi:hypothetical protein